MLELKPNCEHCGKDLPNTSTEAMICSYECTYCKECALIVFENVCPSCGGNFEKRPIRPSAEIKTNPASAVRIFKPKNIDQTQQIINKYKNIAPESR